MRSIEPPDAACTTDLVGLSLQDDTARCCLQDIAVERVLHASPRRIHLAGHALQDAPCRTNQIDMLRT